jgi:hypothetical protein
LARHAGPGWAELVSRVSTLPRTDPHAIAFTLTLRRLERMQPAGRRSQPAECARCAAETVARFAGSEQELLDLYAISLSDVLHELQSMPQRRRSRSHWFEVA